MLTIAAGLCARSPFVAPIDQRDEANRAKRKLAGPSRSDHIALLRAVQGWHSAKSRRRYCEENFLSYESMRTISELRRQLATALYDAGFSGRNDEDRFSGAEGLTLKATNLLRAALCAGMYPNILHIRKPQKKYYEVASGAIEKTPEARELRFYCKSESVAGVADTKAQNTADVNALGKIKQASTRERVFLHPSSVNFSEGGFISPWLVYFQKVRTSKIFIRDSTMVPPYALLLFGGSLRVEHTRNKIVVDDWMYFNTPARVGVLIRELRSELECLLSQKMENPHLEISSSPLIDAVTMLLGKSGF